MERGGVNEGLLEGGGRKEAMGKHDLEAARTLMLRFGVKTRVYLYTFTSISTAVACKSINSSFSPSSLHPRPIHLIPSHSSPGPRPPLLLR